MHETISIRPSRYWMLLILMLVATLAMPRIQSDALWFDEVFTHIQAGTGELQHLNKSIVDTIISTAVGDNTWPPFYYVVQNIWSRFAGHTLVSEHMLTLLVGLIGVSVTYRFGKTLFGESGGLLTALLSGTSAFYVHYMHESRAYIFYTLFILLAAWLYWLLVHRKNIESRWLRWGFVASICLALYTHYVSGAFILGIALYHLLVQLPLRGKTAYMDSQRWLRITKLWINGCILFAPWSAVLVLHLMSESELDRALPAGNLLLDSIYSFSNSLSLIILPPVIATTLYRDRQEVRFLWVWAIATGIVITIINLYASFLFHPRHYLPYLFIVVLLLVHFLLEMNKRIPGIALIIAGLWVGAGMIAASSTEFTSGLKVHIPLSMDTVSEMQSLAEQCVQEDDVLIFSLDEPVNDYVQYVTMQYYFLDTVDEFTMMGQLIPGATELSILEVTGTESRLEEGMTLLDSYVADYDTMWLMTLSDVPNRTDIFQFDNIMEAQGYVSCPPLDADKNIDMRAYTRNGSLCPAINSCN